MLVGEALLTRLIWPACRRTLSGFASVRNDTTMLPRQATGVSLLRVFLCGVA